MTAGTIAGPNEARPGFRNAAVDAERRASRSKGREAPRKRLAARSWRAAGAAPAPDACGAPLPRFAEGQVGRRRPRAAKNRGGGRWDLANSNREM